MMLPVGHYRVYVQYPDNGFIYQSGTKDVDVIGSTTKLGSNPLQISVPLAAPANNPIPAEIPGTFVNTVNGTISYQDGTGVPGAAVSLWQSSDDSSGNFYKKAETATDNNGNYLFNDVKDVYRTKQNVIDRLRRDQELLASLSMQA
jgi:hypothetical protein